MLRRLLWLFLCFAPSAAEMTVQPPPPIHVLSVICNKKNGDASETAATCAAMPVCPTNTISAML